MGEPAGIAPSELRGGVVTDGSATSMPKTGDEDYLDSLLGQVEGHRLEFKEASENYDTNKAIGYCAALANEGGGHLILGVTNKLPRQVVGSKAIRNPAELEHRIFVALKIKVMIREVEYEGLRVVVFQVPSRMRGVPIDFDGRFLMRAGESLVPMSAHQVAAILDETQGRFEGRPAVESVSAAEVERLLDLDAYFSLMPDGDPGDRFGRLQVLEHRRLIVASGRPGLYDVTNGGALFLARSLEDFPSLALRRVRVIRYAGTDRINAISDRFENGGYGPAFESLLEHITTNIPTVEVIDGGLRRTVPAYAPRALREFVANALIHQDLEETGIQIAVEIFEDRLEIRNPGEPLIAVERFVDETRARNPELAEIMRLANICEVRGSGVDRALEQIEGLMQPAPRFQKDTAATRVTLYTERSFDDMTQEERIWSAFLHCCVRYQKSDRLTNSSLRARHGLPSSRSAVVSQTIAAAIEVGFIKLDPRVGSSKRHAAYVPFFA